jgi:hypothetical protein
VKPATTPESVPATTPESCPARTPESFSGAGFALLGFLALGALIEAHSGPPFPIVSSQAAGNYDVAIWTDPDATDDAVAGGQFWVVLTPRGGATEIPAATRVLVAIRATDRPGPELTAAAAPVGGLVSRQFAALRMDHEGRFAVRVAVDGPLGRAEVTSAVDATYDARPAPVLFLVYLLPFVALGLLWVKLLRRRRALRRGDIAPPR